MTMPTLFGVVHLPALPGDPGFQAGSARPGQGSGFDAAVDLALRDAHALVQGGIGAIIVENFGSWPFPKGTPEQPTPPWQIAFLARAVDAVMRETGARVGVNVLRNDACGALGIAAACGASFIRVNVHVGAAVTDQGLIEGRAFETLRVRDQLRAHDVGILADVRVKHAAPLVARPIVEEVSELVDRGGADAVIVTGAGTGRPVSQSDVDQVVDAAGATPVLVGSGFSPERADLLRTAHGAIVGTWVKVDGNVRNPVDPARVRALVDRVRTIRG